MSVMPLFDTRSGSLDMPAGPRLTADLPFRQVAQSGLTFVREITMRTGWAYNTTGAYAVAGHTVYFALGFKDDKLRKVAFAFTDLQDEPLPVQRDAHDRFLAAELGPPVLKTAAFTGYDFSWGKITSSSDPRTDRTEIVMSWV